MPLVLDKMCQQGTLGAVQLFKSLKEMFPNCCSRKDTGFAKGACLVPKSAVLMQQNASWLWGVH